MVSELVKEHRITQTIYGYDFRRLLKGRTYITIGSQIIFEKEDAWHITTILNEARGCFDN